MLVKISKFLLAGSMSGRHGGEASAISIIDARGHLETCLEAATSNQAKYPISAI